MGKKYTAKEVALNELILDKENPRFAELYGGSERESDIVEYLLFTEAAEDLAKAIVEANEFYDDRPLWVYKVNGKYIVKDGNRRCAAVKALQTPNKYNLGLSRFEVEKLPVLEYRDLSDLEKRIRQEHTGNLFKKWGRIAKAIDIYRLFKSGSSIKELSDIDSNPREFIKTASFYYEATKVCGEKFKVLVREGKGKNGGKTIVFERMFKERGKCGYSFRQKTSEINIYDKTLFDSYIVAIVEYLTKYPNTGSRTIDNMSTEVFLEKLKPFGFLDESCNIETYDKESTSEESKQEESEQEESEQEESEQEESEQEESEQEESEQEESEQEESKQEESKQEESKQEESKQEESKQEESKQEESKQEESKQSSTRSSTKRRPDIKRKGIPPKLRALINECYKLDQSNFANAKTALTRVTLECTLKFTVENTLKPNKRAIKESNHFRDSYFNKKNNNPLAYTNYELLKSQFISLITDVGIRKAFENFDLERPHQIIHNYHVTATPADAKSLCDNLIVLLEFMLQDESDLIKSLDMSKL